MPLLVQDWDAGIDTIDRQLGIKVGLALHCEGMLAGVTFPRA